MNLSMQSDANNAYLSHVHRPPTARLPPLPRDQHVGKPPEIPHALDRGHVRQVYGHRRAVDRAGAGCCVGEIRCQCSIRIGCNMEPQKMLTRACMTIGRHGPPGRVHGRGTFHRLSRREIHPDAPARREMARVHERDDFPRHDVAFLAAAATSRRRVRRTLVGVQTSHAEWMGKGRFWGCEYA